MQGGHQLLDLNTGHTINLRKAYIGFNHINKMAAAKRVEYSNQSDFTFATPPFELQGWIIIEDSCITNRENENEADETYK
jgi:hypothetical protein